MKRSIHNAKLRAQGITWRFEFTKTNRWTLRPGVFIAQTFPSGEEHGVLVFEHMIPAFVAYLRRAQQELREQAKELPVVRLD